MYILYALDWSDFDFFLNEVESMKPDVSPFPI